MIKASNAVSAAQSMTTHTFKPGAGYVDYGAPIPLNGNQVYPETKCLPAADAADGSMHVLTGPGGTHLVAMSWVAKERAWARSGGFRMAFAAKYLAHYGWAYKGPVV